MDTIKEVDIPKYFGDSNSGCAYVLYYQAVDLDLASLGLRSADPDPYPTTSSSPQQAPSAPPGLSLEEDSDMSEPAPATPALPHDTISPSPKVSSTPPLSVSIPPPELPQPTFVSSNSTTPSSPNVKSGLFSIRHSPSKPTLTRNGTANATQEPVPPIPPIPIVKIHLGFKSSIYYRRWFFQCCEQW